MRSRLKEWIVLNRWSIGFGVLALVVALYLWMTVPHDKVQTLIGFHLRLLPFGLALVSISLLEPPKHFRLDLIIIAVCFLLFYCFFVPKIFDNANQNFKELYYYVLVLIPFIILSFVACYRLGGGKTEICLRIGVGLLLLMLSGLEDLSFLLLSKASGTEWQRIPETWDWATHMTVRMGHMLTKSEAFVFIAAHVCVAFLVLFLPLPWVESFFERAKRILAPQKK